MACECGPTPTTIERGKPASQTSSSTSSELIILRARPIYATFVDSELYPSTPALNMSLMTFSRHTVKQLKFVLPGGLLTYYFDSWNVLLRILNGQAGEGRWSRLSARLSIFSAAITVSSFLYVLALPLVRGEQPNYRSWRQSGVLSTVIPVMTVSIVAGWSLLVYTLGQWSSLGYLEGIIAATALYALAFGLLGLIPAPRVRRQ
ncbi:hypothetical protein DICSQDRAFT_99951 [Dichomitus squalens LYAD-421 SS1]|nr:uncharacterized protein DICSQDRAFT_99951 [Dichomitus squalens LYAD-421 SS1]EJF64675.1 hypothetical protein DICSQDRAFT_99951 [Dichomitus squalens LYAD-421 SS1]TBU63046.1 hypothetical protein BD310DRAFT_842674 [Dichomitus squalens]